MPFFLDYAKDSRYLIKMLAFLVVVETFVILALGFLSIKPRVIYINPSVVVGTARVGYVPDEAAIYFGMSFISFFGNVNHLSALEQYKVSYNLMSPKLQSAMKRTLETEIKEIEKSNMSIQTIPVKAEVKNSKDDNIVIEIEAIRVSYVYGQETKKDKILYTLSCQKTATRKSNPFGLEVVSYDSKVIAALSGNVHPAATAR